jgi:chromosome segregation ATPase
MAEDKNIAISIEVKGTEQSIESVKDLKAAIKAAKDEQIKAAQVFGESSKEFIEASKNVSKLKDKVEDLNDSTQSLKGSGVERASAGFNQLGEGLRNLDFDKVKVGLVAMKSALAAVGIGLIVQAVTYLVENFEELSKGSGLLAQALQFIGTIVNGLKDYFLKFGDILQGINPELRGMSKEIDNLKDSMGGLLTEQMGRIERLTALAKANGESTIAYEKLKQDAIIATNKLYVDGIINYVRAGGIINEEQQKQLAVSLENIRNATNAKDVLEINHTKKIEEENTKRYQSTQKRLDDELKAKNDAFAKELQGRIDSDAMIAAYEAEQKALADAKKVEEDAAFLEQARLQSEEVKAIAYSEADLKQELKKQELESFKTNYDAQLQTAQSLTSSLSSLSDSYFYFKRKNLEKGSAEDLKQAKKQFDINKGLAIASATISGIQGVVNALSAQSIIPEPYGTVLKVVTAAAVGAAAVANIAKIASSKFDAGGGGGGGGGAATASIAIPAPPSISTAENNVNKGTSFDETGKKIGGESKTPTVQVKATIGVDEVSSKQNRVDTLEKQSTF